LIEAGIEVEVLPLPLSVRAIRKDSLGVITIAKQLLAALHPVRYAGTVARFARKHNAALLHCNSLKADFYGALAGRIARMPVVWHVRDHIDPSYLPGPAVRLFRTLARSVPAAIITNSLSTTAKLFPRSLPPRRIVEAVYDGLTGRELQTPQPAPATEFRHCPPRIGIIGRIASWKGQHVFLEAARLLSEKQIAAQYFVLGSPLFGEEDYEAQLKRDAAPLGNRVQFLGFQSDIPAVLRDLDILVHASTSAEPFGQVVIEGMAEGLPVIGSDGGGVREIITSGENGILTPMGDAPALAEAIEHLIQNPGRASALARAGWVRAHEVFTAQHSADRIADVYDRVLRQPAR
jgi:glycosyltransferase involved in cell wall biosynthesis